MSINCIRPRVGVGSACEYDRRPNPSRRYHHRAWVGCAWGVGVIIRTPLAARSPDRELRDDKSTTTSERPVTTWRADDTSIPIKDRIRALRLRIKSATEQSLKHAHLAQSYADRVEEDMASVKRLEGRDHD